MGRVAECASIDAVLESARKGKSVVLLVRGEPGIGKTALLEYARDQGGGMEVASARGIESESELAFSGLSELLRPLLGMLDAIPEHQAAALRGALSLGPPAAVDPFTISAATLSLLAAEAEERPVLALADDAFWLDESSQQALLFAARRLSAEGIALLVALREDVPSLFDGSGLPELVLQGLDEEAARVLLGRVSAELEPPVVDQIVHATEGNPLGLIEIPGLLSGAQRTGREPLPEPLPTGKGIEQAFLARVRRLPADVRQALLVAAASPEAIDAIVGALKVLRVDWSALEQAEEEGLLVLEGEVRFRHPLLRSAVYHDATSATRRRAHAALAEALVSADTEYRRAWHLALATLSPDEPVAALLEEVARKAQQRHGHSSAARSFERAAALSSDREARIGRLHQAAIEFQLSGHLDLADALLEEALGMADDLCTRADLQLARGRGLLYRGATLETHTFLVQEAETVEPVDPDRAAAMFAEACMPAWMAAQRAPALESARRGYGLACKSGNPSLIAAVSILYGYSLACGGESQEAFEILGEMESALAQQEPLGLVDLHQVLATGLMILEEYERARHILGRAIAAARSAAAPAMLPYPLATLAQIEFRSGRWAEAYAHAGEAVRLATDTGQLILLGWCSSCLALVEAGLGHADDCREHAGRALELARELGTDSVVPQVGWAHGILALGVGAVDEAVAWLEPAAQIWVDQLLELNAIQGFPLLVESYVRAGRRGEAEALLEVIEERGERTGRIWTLASAGRCRGLLAGEDEYDAAFDLAFRYHDKLSWPFERAHTELCFGERLRRSGRRTDARKPLRAALGAFERLGAAQWAARARKELRASGESPRRRDPALSERLTDHELQVAFIVARGATNKEAAAELFLSPKTVDFHLRNIYRKVGVRSRTELAALTRLGQN